MNNAKFFSSSETRRGLGCLPSSVSQLRTLTGAALLLLLGACLPLFAQTNEWVWMGGSNILGNDCFNGGCQRGVYGTLGGPAAENIPGSRRPLRQRSIAAAICGSLVETATTRRGTLGRSTTFGNSVRRQICGRGSAEAIRWAPLWGDPTACPECTARWELLRRGTRREVDRALWHGSIAPVISGFTGALARMRTVLRAT